MYVCMCVHVYAHVHDRLDTDLTIIDPKFPYTVLNFIFKKSSFKQTTKDMTDYTYVTF